MILAPEGSGRGALPSAAELNTFDQPQRVDDLGKQLVNAGIFDWALEENKELGIPRVESRHERRMALLLWNQMRHGVRPNEARMFGINPVVTEDIQTGDLALPTKWALPIIRRIYPAIFDAPMFATQAMPGPLAYAFYLDFKREADNTDFRAIAPFTAFLAGAVAAAATTFTVKMAADGVIGVGPYQLVAGQVVTLGLGTANAEQLTIASVSVSGGTATVTTTAGATKTHNAGDVVYVAAPAAAAEAAVPGKSKLSLTRTSVTAQKWMMAATWSTEAMEDARAQLNLDVEGEMVQAISTEIGRELFGTILSDIVQGATGGNTTIPAIGTSNVQDYRFLSIQPIYNAEAQIYAKRFHDADTILAGLDIAANIQKQDQFHIAPPDNSLMSELGVTHLGTFQGKYQVYKTPFLPANLAILFQKPKDWLHAGYVYMPYIPLSPMPLVYAGYNASTGNYTNTDEWTRNIRTRAGRLMTVSDEFGLLTQA